MWHEPKYLTLMIKKIQQVIGKISWHWYYYCSEQSTSEDDDEGAEESDHSVKKEQDEIRHIKRKEDVDEGKTVFVKNLPFSADDNEFRECMEKFGPVFYALICKDKLTERSKCSGFVKFKVRVLFSFCFITNQTKATELLS